MLFDRKPKQFNHWRFILVTLAILVFFSASAKPERLPIKTYTVADGLLRDNVSKIKQDSRGFLWFCTVDGISRFDGYAFTNFTTADGLPDRHVNDFLETRTGAVYIATDGGLAKLNPRGLAKSKEIPLFTVILPDNALAKNIRVLFEDDGGQVWVGTTNGFFKLNAQNELEAVNLGKPLVGIAEIEITAIIKDRRGAIWLCTMNNGLFRILPDGAVEQFNKSDGLPDVNISDLHEDRNGRIWVGLRPNFDAGLVLLVNEPRKNQNIVERHYTMKDGLPSVWITDLFESSDGKFWVGTTKGLCEWQGGESSVCKTYTKENDFCDEEIWSIIEDKDNNLWTGTRCGLKKWTRFGFTSYTQADGMGLPMINSVFENAAGELFASFDSGIIRTVSRFDGEKFELVKPNFPASPGGFGWGWKQTVWQDSAGNWWFPWIQGVYRFPKPARFEDLSKITPQNIMIGAKPMEVFRIFEDSRGDIWISTITFSNELWRWEKATDRWQDFTAEAGFGKYRIGSAFVEDKSGNLWIGASSDRDDAALIRYRDGRFNVFPQSEYPLLAGWLRDLYVDKKGRLWIADTTNGVLRLDDVNADKLNFTNFTTAEGLSSNGSYCLTEDEFGRIYVGSGRGLDRLTPDTGEIENFTTADGLPNSFIEIAYRDRKNNLWFGTSNGLARYIPEPKRNRQSPTALITGLRVNGEAQSVSILGEVSIPSLELDSDHRQITVEFIGLGASLGEKLKYEYRFGDADWTQTNERTVNFANLASDEYQFEVRAVTADRLYSSPASVSFRIAAPVWQRWWFIVLAAVLIGLAIYSIYRNRLKRLLEVADMRTRIATDLHDDIGANLTKIAILSEVAQQQLGRKLNGKDNLLGSVAEISRESVSAMGDIVWAINPKKDSLIGLTRRMRSFAEEILERREIDLQFNAPVVEPDLKLDANLRRNIYLIFKESVNNIVRHSNASEVVINFRLAESELTLEIGDNGSGFDAAREFDGNGLLNINKRAEDCGGRLEIDSIKGAGTKIVLRLKLKSAVWTW